MSRIKVFILCAGLGHVRRGFESFTRECFDELKCAGDSIEMFLFKGAGASAPNEKALPELRRSGAVAKMLGRWLGREAYVVEQLTFVASLLPYLLRERPEVIYFSDPNMGNVLWHVRRRTGLRYRLLFSNGGPCSPPFERWDLVQQVSPEYYEIARLAGVPDSQQTLIPYGVRMSASYEPITAAGKSSLRRRLQLPVERKIVVSLGAINSGHKRMDYLIREMALLPAPRPYLLMVGQQEQESSAILELAGTLLGEDGFAVRTVGIQEVPDHLRSADVFALASLGEGFGRVYVEALANGLGCAAHDFATSRYVLGPCGTLRDLRQSGALASALTGLLADSEEIEPQRARHRYAYNKFSWDVLRSEYLRMLTTAAQLNS